MLAPFSPHGEKVAAKRPDEGAVARWGRPHPAHFVRDPLLPSGKIGTLTEPV